MKTPKTRKIISLIIVLLVAITSLFGCEKPDPVKQKLVCDLRALAKIDKFDDLYVSIYWLKPGVTTRYPYSKQDLIDRADNVCRFQGDEIEGKLEWFGQIREKDIEVVEQTSSEWARFYIIIQSFSEGKIFDFLLFGTSDSNINFIVNDVEIVWSEKLLDALQPLLVLNEEALFDFELYRLTWPDTIVSRQL
ncbi:MAG TPA: hypothetical protein PK459_01350 [Anaerolineaceae bacterium]|nr:hypothetical protein [Anaerolineaceae bacterium]HQC63724.1 hypothetical protein [Anaerolineaceae bacterium]